MAGLHFPRQALRCLGNIPLAAVVGCDLQHKTVAAGSDRLSFAHGRLQLRMEPRTVADDAQADVVLVQALGLTTQCLEEQVHQGTDFLGRALPVFTGEREQGQHLDLGLGTHLDHGTHSIDTRFMPGNAWHKALLRPAIIPVHDDRDMARHHGGHSLLGLFHEGVLTPYTAIRSFSLSSVALVIWASASLVSLSISATARRSSSSLISLSLTSFFRSPKASRRMLRTATRASSAALRACLVKPLRVSSVRAGMEISNNSPRLVGLRFRPALWMALSTAASMLRSKATTCRVRESFTVMLATWVMEVSVP